MVVGAPLRVPVELRRGGPRWFRLANVVSEEALGFGGRELPEELEEVMDAAFFLPEDPTPIVCRGRVLLVESKERDRPPRRLALRFLGLGDDERARISRYVEERLSP